MQPGDRFDIKTSQPTSRRIPIIKIELWWDTCMILFKDLIMMHRALWDRMHGGPRGSVSAQGAYWRIRVASEYVRSHNARYIILKSDNDMNNFVLTHYDAEFCKRSSEAGDGEPCIVENVCMVLYATCIARHLWRHNDSGVTKSPQNMNTNV